MKKYPLILKPVIKNYIWGGKRLIDEYGFETDADSAAEAWTLACHKDGTNTVLNGELSGKSLSEVLKLWGFSENFPILIKLIDAHDRLSVQVHPDNSYAFKNEGEPGKTEMWYIVDAEEGSRLAYGFNRKLDKAEFEERIKTNTLDEVINYVPVKKGDVFFITAGTLHAIGKGILIAEIQQNSNTTYRVSDYGRLGADGKPRELHLEKALDVTVTDKPALPYGAVGKTQELSFGTVRSLAECEFFKTELLTLSGETEIIPDGNFVSLTVLSGNATLEYENEKYDCKKGDSILIPKDTPAKIFGKAEIIISK